MWFKQYIQCHKQRKKETDRQRQRDRDRQTDRQTEIYQMTLLTWKLKCVLMYFIYIKIMKALIQKGKKCDWPMITRVRFYWWLLYSAILHSRADRLAARLSHVFWMSDYSSFYSTFSVCIEVVYIQRYWDVTWLVPRETAVSAHVLCAPYNHAPVYSVTYFIRSRLCRVL